ncbi:MAG TPA: TatD family hydrolase [Candidatus Paceibacterota bacterium]|nr:TatD family hydrolase [Candidatus Paceibacterota bacterium]HQB56961.1 TatD family hydrolase [Candidatus Paceibacterota bacterium]
MNFNLEKVEYVDIHSHLSFKDYRENLSQILKRMKENKVATICIGTDLEESLEAKKIAEENENVLYSIALHPHDNLKEFDFAFENQKKYFSDLKEISKSEKCVTVGECGLDYFYISKEFEGGELVFQKERQKEIFKRHIELALDLDLPLMLHIRPSETDGNREDAYLDAIEILKEYRVRGNFHFFTSTKKVMEKILKNLPDFSFSIPAVCTFTDEYDEMIKAIPLDKIHIETDSPFVLPKNKRKEAKQNEPSFVIEVFEKVCEIRKIEDKNKFKNVLKENFEKMFLK